MAAMTTFTLPFSVQGVFDEEGLGRDFAYTIGLHHLGRPELLLRSRPSHGHDPGGGDWHLSLNDLGHLLNELGMRLLRGSISIGSEVTEVCDAGATVLRLRLDPPEPAENLEAYGVHPDALVVPVRWSLHRAGAAVPAVCAPSRQVRRRATSGESDGRTRARGVGTVFIPSDTWSTPSQTPADRRVKSMTVQPARSPAGSGKLGIPNA
jgi:hypothetical protein